MAKVLGLQRWRQKIVSVLPQAARDEMREANNENANDFMSAVELNLVRGDPEGGHLEDTLEKRSGDPAYGGLGILVSIGGPDNPYPLHLEAGHKAPDGSHVPPQPFWGISKQQTKRARQTRSRKALKSAIQKTARGS